MKLTYIYHSGFAIEGRGITIIIDYWRDPHNIIGHLLKNEGEIYVMASHFHPDHFDPIIFSWKDQRPDIHYILSKDILKHRKANKDAATYLAKGHQYEDDNILVKAFGSTDVGVSWYIETCGKKIFHVGDLNNWHWQDDCPREESQEYEKAYLGELKNICKEVKSLDLLMFPIDRRLGSEYMRGASQFIEKIQVGLFAPMHFTSYPPSYANAFKTIAKENSVSFFEINEEGDTIEF